MPFRLVYGDFDFHVSLPLEEHIEQRLYRIISQAEPFDSGERGHLELARRIADVITAVLEGEMLPPSNKQLQYALAIARELTLELPADVLKYRESMGVFLATHAESYRSSKANRRGRDGPI